MVIEYVEDKDGKKMEIWFGYVLAIAMFLIATVQTICLQNNFQLTFVAGMRIRTALVGAIYRKVRKLFRFIFIIQSDVKKVYFENSIQFVYLCVLTR